MPAGTFQEAGSSFKRKLSKREKKQLKKQEKLNRAKSHGLSPNDENDAGVAEKLYTGIILWYNGMYSFFNIFVQIFFFYSKCLYLFSLKLKILTINVIY